jgi:hypothetical protein
MALCGLHCHCVQCHCGCHIDTARLTVWARVAPVAHCATPLWVPMLPQRVTLLCGPNAAPHHHCCLCTLLIAVAILLCIVVPTACTLIDTNIFDLQNLICLICLCDLKILKIWLRLLSSLAWLSAAYLTPGPLMMTLG